MFKESKIYIWSCSKIFLMFFWRLLYHFLKTSKCFLLSVELVSGIRRFSFQISQAEFLQKLKTLVFYFYLNTCFVFWRRDFRFWQKIWDWEQFQKGKSALPAIMKLFFMNEVNASASRLFCLCVICGLISPAGVIYASSSCTLPPGSSYNPKYVIQAKSLLTWSKQS